MQNPYQPQKAKIIGVATESPDTKLFRLAFASRRQQKDFAFLPGQFMQIGLPGWGECPISLCSSPHFAKSFLELAIRSVGALTEKLNTLRVGDIVDIRGPFGNGFEVAKFKDRPLVLIGGGCGFVPLRPLINDYMSDRLPNTILQIFYGCKNEETLLFKREYDKWRRQAEFNIALEKPLSPIATGRSRPQDGRDKQWQKGMITDLFKKSKITDNSVAVLVGPPAMYKFVVKELLARKLKAENIFLSLEKKMHCGVGACQHCAIGPYYVCQDGPVFSLAQLSEALINF